MANKYGAKKVEIDGHIFDSRLDEPDNPKAGDIYDQAPYSREDYADAKAQGLDLDDWNDYQRYCRMGAWEDWEEAE